MIFRLLFLNQFKSHTLSYRNDYLGLFFLSSNNSALKNIRISRGTHASYSKIEENPL
jgi:hypothetical protein